MAPEEVAFGGYEYRTVGGEIHRRPVSPKEKNPWDSAWLVLDQKDPCETLPKVPPEVMRHFAQARDRDAVN